MFRAKNFFELMLEELREVIYGSQYSFASSESTSVAEIDSDGFEVSDQRDEGDAAGASAAQQFVQTILKSLAVVGQLPDAALYLSEQVRPALKVIVEKEMADIVQSRRNVVTSARSARKKQGACRLCVFCALFILFIFHAWHSNPSFY